MNTQEFRDKLNSLVGLGDDFSALVFFAMRNGGDVILKKANMKAEVLAGIAEGYRESLTSELERFNHDDHMAVLNLSDRDGIVVYRDNFNVNLMKQARGRFYLNKSGTQIDKLDNDILRMDSQIDCMLIDNDFYIVNLKNLDTSKEFATIIRRRANEVIDQIADLEFVDNVDGLRTHLEDLSFARRLMRAMDNSPVTGLPSNVVLDFVRNHQKLSTLLRINGDKIDLATKKSQSAFVSLLNDDFLYSKLTQRDYESSSKDQLRA